MQKKMGVCIRLNRLKRLRVRIRLKTQINVFMKCFKFVREVFDNSFGPFTNGVFYSRNDGGSHVLTGLCMNVLHKGTIVRVMRKRLQHGVAVCCIAIGHTVG